MMIKTKTKSYIQLQKLSGKKVHFKSDCEFFPNFDVTGRIIGTEIKGTELVFKLKTIKGKIISVGSNMLNLRYELVS